MLQLFYKDNKRYEWLKDKLNLSNYELQEVQPYKRITRYEKFINEVKKSTREKRQIKLELMKKEFEKKKKEFVIERNEVMKEIEQEIKNLGFRDIQFPLNK